MESNEFFFRCSCCFRATQTSKTPFEDLKMYLEQKKIISKIPHFTGVRYLDDFGMF